MPGISEYLVSLESLLNKIPFKLSSNIQVENRGDAALYLNGVIIFVDNSELHFKEYFIAIPFLEKLAYSYHYQDKNKKLIFRYDNAEHHQEVKTYPYHKHLKDQEVVLPSEKMSLGKLLEEIINSLSAKRKKDI